MNNSKIAVTDNVTDRTNASQSFFNPWLLLFYDVALFRFISPFLWGCSKALLIERYNTLCCRKHLEVGVGTGYLLDKCQSPIDDLGLMDLSQACLNKTARRLKRLKPMIWRRNILNPIEGVNEQYQSISINYVMHCVAGNYAEKGIAFKHLKGLLLEDGILFGASVVKTERAGFSAKGFMTLLNVIGVFNNSEDTVDELEAELQRYFAFVQVERRSASVLFVASDSESAFKVSQRQVI